MQPALITNYDDIQQFIMAGRAVFTLKSTGTGDHFTYKVKMPAGEKQSSIRFVSLRTGDEEKWTYFFNIKKQDDGTYKWWHAKKTDLSGTDRGVVAFVWFIERLLKDNFEPLEQAEFWHEGRCCRCGRELTHPDSIRRGMGRKCAGRS